MHRALIVAVFVLLGLVCFGCSSTPVPPQAPPSKEGTPHQEQTENKTPASVPQPKPSIEPTVGFQKGNLAPDFRFQKPDGQTVSLSDFRGNVTMLNFWATWCGPCRFEMSFIQALYEDYEWSEKGLKVLTVNGGESLSKVDRFLKEYGLSFPVLLDTKRNIAQAYNVRAIPTTFFIDKNGVIEEVKIGAFQSKSEIERILNKIIE
ncbi:redoxin domain-containing protein [Chloroflexota bacterium]